MWQTTVVWKFHFKWKDGTVTWTTMKDLNDSNLIEIVEYVKDQGIQYEPSFSWWVPFTPCKRDGMIVAVNYRVRKSFYKYGIQISTYVEETKRIGRKNGNTY